MMYIVAVIFFVLTSAVLIYQVEMKELWVLTTAVLGLLFIGLGYSQRPRPQMTAPVVETTPPPAAPAPAPAPAAVTETVEQTTEIAVEAVPPPPELTKVKGIGNIRAKQLNALGVNTIEELSNASARNLAKKLDISPKITAKWIENAKQLAEKS
jgi:predicted flap endonuclease-1-like 5' DNA nuclease